MEILQRLNDQGATVLVASHDMLIVRRMGKRIVTMGQGRVMTDSTVDETPRLWKRISNPRLIFQPKETPEDV